MTIEQGVKTIIWDLDGTLLDSFGVFQEALTDVLPPYGFTMPPAEEILKNYHGSLEDSIRNTVKGASEADFRAIVQDFLTVQDTHYEVIDHHLYKDALQLAERAHKAGITQVVVTNRDHVGRLRASPRHIVEHSLLKPYVDTVIAGDDSEHRKPKPEVLSVFVPAQAANFAETTVVIGDQFVDAQLAHNLGAPAILVNRNGSIPHLEQLGDNWEDHVHMVSSLDEVIVNQS